MHVTQNLYNENSRPSQSQPFSNYIEKNTIRKGEQNLARYYGVERLYKTLQ